MPVCLCPSNPRPSLFYDRSSAPCRVLVLERLTDPDIHLILTRAIARAKETEDVTHTTPAVLEHIVNLSLGDARTALSLLELVLKASSTASEASILATLKRTTISRLTPYLHWVLPF